MQGEPEKEQSSSSCCSSFANAVRVAWPPLLVIVVIGFTYSVFLGYTVIPQYERATSKTPVSSDPNDPNDYTPSYTEIMGVIISFHIFFLMLILCFIRSSITSPGFIPNTEMWREGKFGIPDTDERKLITLLQDHNLSEEEVIKEQQFLKSLPVIERKMGEGTGKKAWERRFCSKCSRYKPDRAHHCRICKQCVLRMDHHCPWIANCVGYENYKFFLLFLLYGSICSSFVLGVSLRRLIRSFRPVLDTNYFLTHDLLVIVAYLLAAFLFVALFLFFCWHMGLVFNSLTTIELREKQNSDRGKVRHQWLVAHQKYDMGSRYANVVHIFGSPWMWLLPIKSDISGRDGTYATLSSVTVV